MSEPASPMTAPRPGKRGVTGGRVALLAAVVVAVELAGIAIAGAASRPSTAPSIYVNWSSATTGCEYNTSVSGNVTYTIDYSNHGGADGFATMGVLVGGRLARFWSIYVPAGALRQRQTGTLPILCADKMDLRIIEFATSPS